jgi:hypothetical protein
MKKVSRFSIPDEDISSYMTLSVKIRENQHKIIPFPAQSIN